MKCIVFVLLFAAASLAAPVQFNSNVTEEAVLFIEGLAEGMGVVMGDPSACATDVEAMAQQLELAVVDLDYGFRHKSLSRILDGTNEIADALHYGADTFQACGFAKVAVDIKTIVVQIESGKVLEVVIEEIVKIFAHGRQVEQLFNGAVNSWKRGDFKTSGNDIGQLVAFLLQPKSDELTANTPKKAVDFVTGLVEGIGGVMGDASSCTSDVDKMVGQLELAFSDISFAFRHVSISHFLDGTNELADALKYGKTGLKSCGYTKVAADIGIIVAQIQTGNVWSLIGGKVLKVLVHGKQVEHLFNGAVSAWKSGDFKTSGNDIGQLVAFLLQPKSDQLTENNVNRTVDFVAGLAEGIGVVMGNPSACTSDVDDMAQQLELAFADISFAFRHKSLSHFLDGTNEIADALKDGEAGFSACGFDKVAVEISAIVAEIHTGKVFEFVVEEIVKIFAHGKQVEHLFNGATNAWKSGDFKTSGNDIGQLVAFLIKPQ